MSDVMYVYSIPFRRIHVSSARYECFSLILSPDFVTDGSCARDLRRIKEEVFKMKFSFFDKLTFR